MSGGQPVSVLFVVPTLRPAGAERQVVDLACRLDRDLIRAQVFFYDQPDSLRQQLDRETIPVFWHQKAKRLDFSLARALADVIDRESIDVLHCTLQNALLFGWLARRLAKRKPSLAVALHTTINVDRRHELADRWLTRPLLKAANQIWFVCHNQARYWFNRFPEIESRSRVIYNGVDTQYFERSDVLTERAVEFRRNLGIGADAPIVSCIAAFRPEKRHDLLLESFHRLLAVAPDAHLVLAGDGPLRERVKAEAHGLGLEPSVHFAGVLKDVRPLLATSACKVLSSTAVETFSMAMLESLAMGVPVVATDIGGASEAVLNGETGYLVAPGDVDDLERGLVAVLEGNADGRMGDRAQQLVQNQFTTELMVSGAAQAIQELSGCGVEKLDNG